MLEEEAKPKGKINVVIPQQGILYDKETSDYILCKPKLMPLKSITLEKLENMQKEAELKIKEMENARLKKSQEKELE